MANIKVMVCKVGKEPYVKEIPNELEAINQIVEGYIETAPLINGLIVVYNEDGMHLGLPLNNNLGLNIFGNFFVARVNGTELASITDEDIDLLNRIQFLHRMHLLSEIDNLF